MPVPRAAVIENEPAQMRLLLAEVLAINSQRADDFPFADRQPGSGWPGRRAGWQIPLRRWRPCLQKKRQSHDDGRNTPRASGLSGRSSPAGSRSSAKLAEPYPQARYPDTAPAPGHRPPVQWRQFAAASHPDGLTPPPPDGYPRR